MSEHDVVKAARKLERELILAELEKLAASWEQSSDNTPGGSNWAVIQLRSKIKQLRLQRIR